MPDPKPGDDDCCERQILLLERFWRILIIPVVLLGLTLLVLLIR